jgi:sulfatase maturation enzyme AslB (radical SAM superfamily)
MNCIEDFKAGTLDSSPRNLKKFSCDEECSKCEYYPLCGGRCLYWRKARLWPEQGDRMICDSVKFLIDELKAQLPRIEKALKTRKVSIRDFEYEKYFGPEIIP